MASLSKCAPCTRLLQTSCKRASQSSQQLRSLHTPAPIFLDFLAPSWGAQSKPRPRSQPFELHALRAKPHRRRWLSSTSPRQAKAIRNPKKDDEGKDMIINITPRAAHRLQTIAETDKNPDLALRVSVESGGCHGFQYLMSLTSTKDTDPEEDILFENETAARDTGEEAYKAKVVMDEPSLELLKGSSVDYTMELIGSQFKLTGIPGAKSSCGCGTSFDIA